MHLLAIEFPDIDPNIVRIGPLAVRWYGMAYVAAFLVGYFQLSRLVKSGRLRLSNDQLSALLGWLVIGVLVGGRLGWWTFYHRSAGSAEPWYEPFAIWHGGMSFHGGLLGVIVVVALWCWKSRVSLPNVADCLALAAPVGLFLGRLANFINGELVGRPTDLPWGVVFPGEKFARHPSQLYEAVLEGPVLLGVLWLYSRRRQIQDGRTAALFLVLYGLVRFAVEFSREPDEQVGFIAFGWVTMGQILSILMILAGILGCYFSRLRAARAVPHTVAFSRFIASHFRS